MIEIKIINKENKGTNNFQRINSLPKEERTLNKKVRVRKLITKDKSPGKISATNNGNLRRKYTEFCGKESKRLNAAALKRNNSYVFPSKKGAKVEMRGKKILCNNDLNSEVVSECNFNLTSNDIIFEYERINSNVVNSHILTKNPSINSIYKNTASLLNSCTETHTSCDTKTSNKTEKNIKKEFKTVERDKIREKREIKMTSVSNLNRLRKNKSRVLRSLNKIRDYKQRISPRESPLKNSGKKPHMKQTEINAKSELFTKDNESLSLELKRKNEILFRKNDRNSTEISREKSPLDVIYENHIKNFSENYY